ncbi:pitrilysin family protein [Clostridium carnis]
MEYLLSNNIKLIYKKGLSNLTSVSIALEAGAAMETEKLGVAHATEHMIYKGTKKRSESDINYELSKIFGFQNAMTNFPYVIYYGTLLGEDLKEGLEIFADLLINPLFEEAGFKEEMDVIKEELKEWDEELDQYCEDKLFINSFKSRRIKYPIIGTMEDLNNISLVDIKDFYNNYYVPENTSIAIVTSLDFEEVKNIVEELFLSWKTLKNMIKKSEVKYEEPIKDKFIDIRSGSNTCRVEIVFPIHNLNENEIKALRIFNEFFGEGVNSILYDTLRTKNGLIYDVITKIALEKYIKLYKITFNTSSDNINKTLELINQSIENLDLFKEKLTNEDIINLVKSIKLKRLFREEQSIILAKELSTYSAMFNDYKIYEKELVDLEKVSKDLIFKVAKSVLKSPSIEIIKNNIR